MFVFRPVTCPLTLSGEAVVLHGQSSQRLLVLEELFVVEQEIPAGVGGGETFKSDLVLFNIFERAAHALLPLLPFTIEYILNAGLCDYGVVTFEPLVFVLADEACVVAAL